MAVQRSLACKYRYRDMAIIFDNILSIDRRQIEREGVFPEAFPLKSPESPENFPGSRALEDPDGGSRRSAVSLLLLLLLPLLLLLLVVFFSKLYLLARSD